MQLQCTHTALSESTGSTLWSLEMSEEQWVVLGASTQSSAHRCVSQAWSADTDAKFTRQYLEQRCIQTHHGAPHKCELLFKNKAKHLKKNQQIRHTNNRSVLMKSISIESTGWPIGLEQVTFWEKYSQFRTTNPFGKQQLGFAKVHFNKATFQLISLLHFKCWTVFVVYLSILYFCPFEMF